MAFTAGGARQACVVRRQWLRPRATGQAEVRLRLLAAGGTVICAPPCIYFLNDYLCEIYSGR
jgi:hypothetical protein